MAGLFEAGGGVGDGGVDLLDDLTASQRRAVKHGADGVGGPLIVLAGPGTGKTRVITRRVAWLVRRGIEPSSILAVTYTRKAAQELRDRLVGLIGPAADSVRALTFHAFGQTLIRRFSDLMDLPREVRLIDDGVGRRVLRELVHREGLLSHLRATGRETAIGEVARMIAAMGEAMLTPAEALEKAADWGRRLDRGELDPATVREDGDDERLLMEAERTKQRTFADAARLAVLYRAECGRRGWLTYPELLMRPIELLREHEHAAAIVRSEIRHVVVDEFQDSNAARIELLRLVVPPVSAGRGPDVMVVGDDDQAIYGFSGADDRTFARFERIWTPGRRCPRVELDENHRSASAIIDVSARIMAGAAERFAPEKVIGPPRGGAAERGSVEGVLLKDDGEAGATIAAMILADRQQRGAEAPAWSKYAVIARSWTDGDRIMAVLEAELIPVRRGKGRSWRSESGVRDLVAWADALVRGDRSAVQALLVRPPMAIGVEGVAAWSSGYVSSVRRARMSAEAEASEAPIDEAAGLVEWIAERADGDERAMRFVETYRSLRRRVADATAREALLAIIEEAGLAHGELLPGREHARRVAALGQALRLADSAAEVLERPADLGAFLRYLDDLQGEEIASEDEGSREAEDDVDAVRIETAHGSKGLEFDTVFVPRVRSQHGYPTRRGVDEPLVPRWMTEEAGVERHGDAARRDAEERRVFYVACTRAERRLVLLAKAVSEATQKRKDKSGDLDFFDELTRRGPGPLVPTVTASEALDRAARVGVRVGSAGVDAVTGVQASQRRAAMLQRIRGGARRAAAEALDVVDRVDVSEADLVAADRALALAARQIALGQAMLRGAGRPAWAEGAEGAEGAAEEIRVLADRLAAGTEESKDESMFRPMRGPLELSFSSVDQFERCSWCWYLKNVLKWPEAEGDSRLLGTLVHRTLQRFHGETQATGQSPGLARLQAICREEFFERSAPSARDQRAQLEQALAQLERFYEVLHDPADDVEDVERVLKFAYPAHGQTHRFEAKLDRLDRWRGADGRGGHRIVDYKTGMASAKLVEPKATDLQMGIYAMALKGHQGLDVLDDAVSAVGVAEYWVLSTGQRGRIALEDLDLKKIRAKVDSVIGKMLAGEYERGKQCRGMCSVLGAGDEQIADD